MRVLFTTQPGSGHWRPLAPLAKALGAKGHEVAFATTPIQCGELAKFGFRCITVGDDDWVDEARKAPAELPARPVQAETVWAEVFVGSRARRALPDLLKACRSWRPDLLVRDATEFAGCVAAERIGIPHVTVQVGAWRPELQRLIGPALDRLRATVGLPPDPEQEMLHRYLLLSLTPPSFADPAKPLLPTARSMRYIPFDMNADGRRAVPWAGKALSRPLVYATLGTAYNRTPGLVQAILTALREEPIELVLTLGGGIDPADYCGQPPQVHVEQYVPQSLLFPRCDLVVCHGGFGTMMTALSHGLPLVMIPIAADQPDNARRSVELGAARMIAPEERTPEAIRQAVRAVLSDPSYRMAAARLRDEIAEMPEPEQVAGLLERLMVEGNH